MAHGFTCIHCGWCEAAHKDTTIESSGDEFRLATSGFTHSLETCPGYESSEPEKETLLVEKDERERYERQIRSLGTRILQDPDD